MEALTPPAVEALTPQGSPGVTAVKDEFEAAVTVDSLSDSNGATAHVVVAQQAPAIRAHSGSPIGLGTNKKRKIETEFGGFSEGDAMADLDDDVADLLRAESASS